MWDNLRGKEEGTKGGAGGSTVETRSEIPSQKKQGYGGAMASTVPLLAPRGFT